ncbi:hypothetical protein HPX80_002152 [Salmonella enterica]|nr:hypothetical protein [Salmonella enterica]
MSKLNLLRKWLSLDEAARYVEEKIGESVAVTDLLRFALDGAFVLSINLQSPKIAKKIEIAQTRMLDTIKLVEVFVRENLGRYTGNLFSPERIIDFAKPCGNELIRLNGVYDTPLLGIERIYAEELYCSKLNLPKPSNEQDVLRGVTLSGGVSGLLQLQEFVDVDSELRYLCQSASQFGAVDNPVYKEVIGMFESIRGIATWDTNAHLRYIPIPKLPDDVYFVAKVDKLNSLIELLNSQSAPNKPKQSQKTANAQAKFIKNLLTAVYGEDVANNPRKHIDGKMAQIRTDLEGKGLSCPSGVTVENWLSDID